MFLGNLSCSSGAAARLHGDEGGPIMNEQAILTGVLLGLEG